MDVDASDVGLERHSDALVVVVTFLSLALLIPKDLVVGGLGAAGRPAALFALVMLAWWGAQRFLPQRPTSFVLLRWVLALYVLTVMLSYMAGLDRGLPGVEANGMDRELLRVLGFVAVIFVVLDGFDSPKRLERLLVWTVGLGAVGATVGILQFAFGFDLTVYIRIPGLQSNKGLINVGSRGSGFARVHGLSRHPIEFGVLMAMLLPIALFLATTGAGNRKLRLIYVFLIVSAIPMSISRAAIVGLMIGVLVLSGGWTGRQRANGAIISVIGLIAYQAISPGLLGTIRGLFANAGEDSSITARTDDYGAVAAFVRERPWFGRGPGTFLADIDRYRVLDNEYLGTIVETGIVGLGFFFLLFGITGLTARRVMVVSQANAGMARSLLAALAVAVVAMATFDGMAYAGFAAVVSVICGAVGALYRIEKDDPTTLDWCRTTSNPRLIAERT